MLHGTTSGKPLCIAAIVVLVGLGGGPAVGKSKLPDHGVRQACHDAFGDREHFDWVPRMGLSNALATCQRAIEQFPDDAAVQLAYAIARDQFAERGGTQDDNAYATEVYRRLAADGIGLAEYALSTMFDEGAGVSTDDALGTMIRARAGDFGASIRCEALRTFGYADLDGNGPSYDIAAAESMAHGNHVCAAYLLHMYWNGYVAPQDLPMAIGDYARYAAVHGDPLAMALVGMFYAHGTGSGDIDPKLQGQFTARQDAERAGAWLLLAHWGTQSTMQPSAYAQFWDEGQLQEPIIVAALQTALTTLGLYDGSPDGRLGGSTRAALVAFQASDIDRLFQVVRAKEKYAPDLGEREPIRLGRAAIASDD